MMVYLKLRAAYSLIHSLAKQRIAGKGKGGKEGVVGGDEREAHQGGPRWLLVCICGWRGGG